MLNWLLALLFGGAADSLFPAIRVAWLATGGARAAADRPGARAAAPAAFLLGWAAGMAYWFGVCYWIQFVLAFHGGLGDLAGWAVFLLFCSAKALHMGVFAWLAGILMRRWWAVPAVAALWVAVEATHGSLGFAWLALGNAGIDMGVCPCAWRPSPACTGSRSSS